MKYPNYTYNVSTIAIILLIGVTIIMIPGKVETIGSRDTTILNVDILLEDCGHLPFWTRKN